MSSEGKVGYYLGQACDSSAAVGVGQRILHRPWAVKCDWQVAGLFLSPRPPGWLCVAESRNEWVLTLRVPLSDLDGIHTLTCALMLLNTDLHGHVSWGGGGGVPSH